MIQINQIIEAISRGVVICDIGQIDNKTKTALNHLVKAGKIRKWRGYWYPVSGASYGLGPLKTCYGRAQS